MSDNDGLMAALGEGFRGMGAVASPAVAQRQAQERENTLPRLLQGLQLANAQRAFNADTAFGQSMADVDPSTIKTSDDLLNALKKVPMDVMATSPRAQAAVKMAGAMQQKEALAQQRAQTLEMQKHRIELEQARLTMAQGKAPPTRNRIDGDQEIQEEYDQQTHSWKQIGKGPRFSKQVSTPTGDGSGSPLGNDPGFWYEYYDKTGKLPPMAWGSAGNPTREQFLKGFPDWKKTHGGGASDTATSQASFKADAGALNALTKDLNTFEPYKKMLDTNADIAIQLGKKIYTTNSQLANKPLNWLRQNATSNPDVAEYLAQMRFVQTEASRVINNPRIVGQLTDEARKEMDQVISGNAPMPVVERVLGRLKADGNNRFNAMRGQQAELKSAMKQGAGDSSAEKKDDPLGIR